MWVSRVQGALPGAARNGCVSVEPLRRACSAAQALELMGQRDSFFRGLLEAVRAGEHLDPGSAPPAADGDPAKP